MKNRQMISMEPLPYASGRGSTIAAGDFERFIARDVVANIDAPSTAYGITHDFEIYPGTHTNKVALRFQEHVMPFFSQSLALEQDRRR